ncbi:hypothetical protein MSG28_013798 [Choristoneura fumiferana]|uniref:Uncharacterized protein n=1 Tax=Choristoneura fumiferana TaxID=7141 RepID=A0ACC0K9H0_CHOFU|nr:hypothetical protein MSG28_013798 [Choristoneura fumiferana]
MSEKDVKDEDAVSNPPSEEQSANVEEIKVNNMLKDRLRKYIKKLDDTNTSITKEESKKLEVETFKQLYKLRIDGNEESYKKIPKFYYKLPRPDEVLSQKLREEARAQFLQKKSKELLDNSELKHLPYFTAEVFGRLQAAEGNVGRVRGVSLFNYIMRRDLESYIAELVPSLAALDGLDSSFSSFYVCTAARKFLFFLDPLRVGRVRIRDVLSCSFLDDLLELREEDLPMELQEQNWFSAASALRVYGQYLNLDRDHNGMLSINELAGGHGHTAVSILLELHGFWAYENREALAAAPDHS